MLLRRKKSDNPRRDVEGECLIPPPVPASVLNEVVFKQPEHEKHTIREYVESQAPDEKVTHLEKVATEHIFDREIVGWDVHTDKSRYWVATNPTNLYSQALFPSLDYTITFHIGLTERIMANRERTATDEQQDRLATAWRRWTQAAEALDRAEEAEDFQAVGMRCRECLLAMVRAVADESMVPENEEAPKAANFIQWSELIAQHIAQGPSAQEIRGYLKAVTKSTWQLVNWLTHASNAVRFDGHMAVDATQNTLTAFGTALIRYERGSPDRCPECSSYRVASAYRPDLGIDPPYVILCESCGWMLPVGNEIAYADSEQG